MANLNTPIPEFLKRKPIVPISAELYDSLISDACETVGDSEFMVVRSVAFGVAITNAYLRGWADSVIATNLNGAA